MVFVIHIGGDLMVKLKTKNKEHKKNEKGQMAIEAVLITVLLLSLTIFASRQMRSRNFIGRMIAEPWRQISGMMSTGNWMDSQQALDNNLHPHVNTLTRVGD